MRELILEILQKIDFEKRYRKLCNEYSDFNKRANLKVKDVEKVVNSFDVQYKYISRDKTFLREFNYGEFFVRLFIGFRGGVVDFSYLIWESDNINKYYKGRLASLAEIINPEFNQFVQFKTPIATSLEDFEIIVNEIFDICQDFENHFNGPI